MNKSPNRFRLPLQKMPFMADWRIKRRLKKAMKARREEEAGAWGHFLAPRYAGATLSFALVILGVGGYQWLPGYVYESETIARGDYLYDWKRSQEKTKLAALNTPAAKAEYYLDLSDRRLAEADTLVQRGNGGFFPIAKAATPKTIPKVKKIQVKPADSLVAGLITESGVYLGQSIEETGKVKDAQVAKGLLQKIDTRLKKQKTELTKINQQSDEPAVGASVPVLIAQSVAHEKLISRAEALFLQEAFVAHIQGRGFGFQPIELAISADEISMENQFLVGLYDEMEALEGQYYAMEAVLDQASDPEVAMMVADEMEVIEDQIEVLDEVAEDQEERLEDLAEDIDDGYEAYVEIVDPENFDADGWADDWYGGYWEDYEDEDEDEDEDDLEIFEGVSDLAEQGFDYLEDRLEIFEDDDYEDLPEERSVYITEELETIQRYHSGEDLSEIDDFREILEDEEDLEFTDQEWDRMVGDLPEPEVGEEFYEEEIFDPEFEEEYEDEEVFWDEEPFEEIEEGDWEEVDDWAEEIDSDFDE